jgi:peptidoglycan/LPS O-acetylase OafA/YrhL
MALFLWLFKTLESHSQIFNDLSYSSPYFRLFYFLIGIHLCYFCNFSKVKISYAWSSFLEIGILLLCLVWLFAENSLCHSLFYEIKNLIDTAIVCAIILVFAKENGCVSRIFQGKVFVSLGESSSYIFLIHYPVKSYLYELIPNVAQRNWIIVIGTLLITGALVVIAHLIQRDYFPGISKHV